jgi:hypothetical protein
MIKKEENSLKRCKKAPSAKNGNKTDIKQAIKRFENYNFSTK